MPPGFLGRVVEVAGVLGAGAVDLGSDEEAAIGVGRPVELEERLAAGALAAEAAGANLLVPME